MHTRSTMGAGLRGPALVEDAESAIVVPPGWSATLTGSGAVRLARSLP
ncbi:hypothetical protein [Nonomuraea mesophila]|nr:hypothetical protein [Nonomuraea mesophila]